MYRFASVKKNRETGAITADLLNEQGEPVLKGPLEKLISLSEERGYSVTNIEQAKVALANMSGK